MTYKSLAALGLAALLAVPGSAVLAEEPMSEVDLAAETSGSAGYAAAKQRVDDARAVIHRGSLGFFEYVRDKEGKHYLQALGAINLFGDGILDLWTSMGDAGDATSLENMKATLPLLAKGNALREKHGAPALKVSLFLTAAEQKQLNWSDTNLAHALKYGNSLGDALIRDNLSWGNDDPYSEWYDREKKIYDGYIAQGLDDVTIRLRHWNEVGEYLTLISPEYHSTGFAHNAGFDSSIHNQADGQAFNRVDAGYTVEEYTALFNEYYNKVHAELDQALAGLQKYGIAMHRLYNPNSGEHFYTGDEQEYEALKTYGWKDESIGWIAPPESSVPVYRLYNANAGDHHYTRDTVERKALIAAGWKDEGIGWYSDTDKTTPLYRQYNPFARAGSHNYTTDANEARVLVQTGWVDEGIAWYGM